MRYNREIRREAPFAGVFLWSSYARRPKPDAPSPPAMSITSSPPSTPADNPRFLKAALFLRQLRTRVMVADGAMGTMLYSRGVFINRCFDELNLSAPQLVLETHREYVRAGAEILETNTFGGNRVRLASFGMADKLRAINDAGVQLARQAAGDSVFVAGAVGPLGIRIEPLGPTSFAEARAHFREQIEALAAAGVDLLIIETFYD